MRNYNDSKGVIKININIVKKNSDELLLAILKGEKIFSIIISEISDIEALETAHRTGTECTKINANTFSFSYNITEKQIEFTDEALKHVSPHIVELCDTAVLSRVENCITNKKVVPEWALKAIKRIIITDKSKRTQMIKITDVLKNKNLISNENYFYLKDMI